MRNLKKISAVMVVVAMLFSLISFGVSAAPADYTMNYVIKTSETATSGVDSVKAGKTVYVDVYATAGEYVALALQFTDFSSVINTEDLTVHYDGYVKNGLINKTGTKISINYTAGVEITADKPVATIKITIPEDAAPGSLTILKQGDYSYTSAEGESDCGTMSDATVTITPSFTATSAKPFKDGVEVTAPVEVGLGTTAEEAVAGITATVSDGTNNEAGYAISDWTSTPEYNADVVDTYTFAGKVKIDGSRGANENAEGLPVTVDVKVVPYTDGVVTAPTGTVMVNAEEGITEEAIKGALPETVEVKNSSKADVYSVVWNTVEGYTNSGKDYVVGNTIIVKGTLTSPSNKGYFTTTDTVVSGTVTVVPANIPGGTIKVNNPIENGKAKVTVTVPAAEIAKLNVGDEIVATVPAAKTGDPAATASVPLKEEDIAAAADPENPADFKAVLTVDKTMKALGYVKDDTFKAYVTVAGTALLNGTGDDAVDYAEGTVVKATSTSGSGFNPGSTVTEKQSYKVEVAETENGTVTVTPESAKEGSSVAVNAVPAAGYKVKAISVSAANGSKVDVNEEARTFVMPASNVTVKVEFEEGADEPVVVPDDNKFKDVEDNFWAAEDIYLLRDAGIINGKNATEFDPEGKVTRAEFTKMIAQLFGVKATSGAVKFEDCGDADWFTPYVAAAVEAGLVTGYSDTEFAPDKTITREEACTIIGRGLKAVAEGELTFTDASDVSEYAAEYVAMLAAKGFINGYKDGSFLPANEITRAESARIVANVFKSLKAEAEAEVEAPAETEAEAEAEAEVETPAEAETEAEEVVEAE